jgi:hypothetical protein
MEIRGSQACQLLNNQHYLTTLGNFLPSSPAYRTGHEVHTKQQTSVCEFLPNSCLSGFLSFCYCIPLICFPCTKWSVPNSRRIARMPLRVRTSIFLAFAFLFLYLVFPFSHDSPSLGEGARVVNALTGSQGEHGGEAEAGLAGTPAPAPSPTFTSTQEAILVTSSTLPTISGATTGTVTGSLQLQKQFEKQYDALGV